MTLPEKDDLRNSLIWFHFFLNRDGYNDAYPRQQIQTSITLNRRNEAFEQRLLVSSILLQYKILF
jgi:hypothetical protein